jgi:lipopolysaccharide/colanic/teichoic acid biosynthesis glycosyltransferase
MRQVVLLVLDLGFVCLATLFALILRENFEVSATRFFDFIPYLIATVALTALIFPGLGLNRTIWRFSTRPDYVRIVAATSAVAVGATSLTFAYDRLDGVARSLPFLQCLMCQAFLVGARVLHKMSHDARQNRKISAAFLQLADKEPQSSVLIVGISKLVEAYLQAIAELAPGRIKVAGIVGKADRHVGRFVATHPVLGVPEEIEAILDGLDVHGVRVDRIVIASPTHALTACEREALLGVERARGIFLQFLAEDLRLDSDQPKAGAAIRQSSQAAALTFEIRPAELKLIARRQYWTLKRATDIVAAMGLFVICLPVMVVAAAFVIGSVGFPVLFWQQRPGLGGRPFRVYKFRTMKSAYASNGRRLSDKERVSRTGVLMRRLRLDELPQLFNILRGDMSFIGPRPLLAIEQSDGLRARLLVRPGLTGWAQVVGGRDISAEDKAALDVWYVRNASLALDLEIMARTIPMVLFGERISRHLIEQAWRDLKDGGVLKGDLAYDISNGLQIGSYPV